MKRERELAERETNRGVIEMRREREGCCNAPKILHRN